MGVSRMIHCSGNRKVSVSKLAEATGRFYSSRWADRVRHVAGGQLQQRKGKTAHMGLLNKFKSMLDSGGSGGGKLDVDARYEMLRKSVSGTMSQFRMVRDRKTGEIVGLKVLDDEKTELFESRFQGLGKPSEGEIAMQFDHPHIVKTLAHGLTTTGKPYLLMEFIEGKGLNSMIIARAPELDGKRLLLMRQMAEAIGVVHEAGFIHRDVCPRNFICNHEVNHLKLIDFGLTLPAKKEFMQPGNRTGTPQYMSPEIARRRSTDQRVDIFSLGVTFYQLCAFELPWPSADMTGKVALLHDSKEPVPLAEAQPRINPELAAVIHRCIAARPDERPADIPTLSRELSRIKTAMV